MDTKQLSDKLLTKLRELSEKPDGWGDIRMIEPADARAILAALPSVAAQAPIAWMLQEPGQSKRWYTSGEAAMQHWVSKGASATPLYAAPVAPAATAQPAARTGLETHSELSTDAVAQLSTESVEKPVDRMSDAERDVLAERARQVTEEGCTPIHDDHNDLGQMASAAACYALTHRWTRIDSPPPEWPSDWARAWWKPTTPRRDLVKAGALILAEIERLDRATAAAAGGVDAD